MTIGAERKRAVELTRELLRRLCAPAETPRVARDVRLEAERLLKHYPTPFHLAGWDGDRIEPQRASEDESAD